MLELTDEVKISIYKRGFTAYENLLNEIYKHDQNKNIFIAKKLFVLNTNCKKKLINLFQNKNYKQQISN